MFLLGAALAIGPWLVPDGRLAFTAQAVLSVLGGLLLIVSAFLTMVTKLYRKSSANMAFVRTGWGGAEVICDSGRYVFPVVHQLIPVSLETMRLNVERRGPHALITNDNLRVDLSAEFYIKVQANKEDILQAARSLGSKNTDPGAVSELVQEKLVSALRTVAATKELVELHAKRDEFASSVQQIVTHDLASNGLTLESVTISSLDQTDPSQLQDRNVFDAQGLRKIAEITQKAKVQRNEIEQMSMEQVVGRNVSTKKKVLEMEREQAEFEAEQKSKIATVQAQRAREVQEFKIVQDEAIARRDIEKMKMIETTEVERTLAVESANIMKAVSLVARHKEQETAQIDKVKAIEVANRMREIAIAEKEQERAAAQAQVLTAEAERERAKQQVTTVEITSEAERIAATKLIAAQQQINEKRLRDQTDADVAAYTSVKKAEAEKQSADMQAAARLKLAEADATSSARRAEGERAIKMVDINIEKERVGVEQARVDVERQSLANRSEFGDAALKFELEKLRIEAEKEFRIKSAEAMGAMMAKAQMQIFGDPTTMSKMSEQFMRAASLGTAMDGLMRTMPDDLKLVAGRVVENLTKKSDDGDSLPSANGHKNA
jgi:uncharacterized membrane protein YqiK